MEVSQFATELFKEDWKAREANLESTLNQYHELVEVIDKLNEKIVSTNKVNKRLIFLCSFLVGLLISSVITIIILIK